jgi:hypothetical protein
MGTWLKWYSTHLVSKVLSSKSSTARKKAVGAGGEEPHSFKNKKDKHEFS